VYLSPPRSQICLNQIAGPRHIAHCTGFGPSLHSSSTTTKIQLNTDQTAGGGGAIIKTIEVYMQLRKIILTIINIQYHIGILTIIILNTSYKLYPTLIICFISQNNPCNSYILRSPSCIIVNTFNSCYRHP
jgi:hypothetical protein